MPLRPTILFDAGCGMCEGAVEFIRRCDVEGRYAFVALGSPAAEALLGEHGVRDRSGESVVLIEGGRAWRRSDAVLRIAMGLGGAWRAAAALVAIPRELRDRVYDLVARNRYRRFGRARGCALAGAGELTAKARGREEEVKR